MGSIVTSKIFYIFLHYANRQLNYLYQIYLLYIFIYIFSFNMQTFFWIYRVCRSYKTILNISALC